MELAFDEYVGPGPKLPSVRNSSRRKSRRAARRSSIHLTVRVIRTPASAIKAGAPTVHASAFGPRSCCLEKEGVAYSRYVDDVTISSRRSLTTVEISAYIWVIYRMIVRKGFSPKRSKQEIQRGDGRMRVTKLLVNAKASLSSQQRRSVQMAVSQLECMVKDKPIDDEVRKAARSTSGRVGYGLRTKAPYRPTRA